MDIPDSEPHAVKLKTEIGSVFQFLFSVHHPNLLAVWRDGGASAPEMPEYGTRVQENGVSLIMMLGDFRPTVKRKARTITAGAANRGKDDRAGLIWGSPSLSQSVSRPDATQQRAAIIVSAISERRSISAEGSAL